MDERHAPAGKPVGRRVVLGLVGLGAAGVLGGARIQNGLSRLLAPLESRDPTGLISLFPLGQAFRFYSVTGSVPRRTAASYRLAVSGLVARPATYTFAGLQAMPQTAFVRDFQCVTGWRVPEVHWAGVPLSVLLTLAGPSPDATAVRFRSFDGAYTESMTMAEAHQPDVIVALQMLGEPVTHEHGGPVRVYAASMYGYKSTKWLSEVEVVQHAEPGYWETRGYDIDGTIRN
ncbi:MAG: molybdopterin-dependent oxidoreductase [Actinomycetota bacterium]|nr:molybdopterin-dependent oxidoreductase [Actinomycetota bacterium]